MINLLEKQFDGKGEVKTMHFNQVYKNDYAYIYTVSDESINFEVFERRNSPVCIDFVKRIYSETEFKETYPKANSFGVWAWTYKSIEEAVIRAKGIESKCREALK